jgi:diguanylate cyclase (GGDEF)-like protein
VQLFEVARDRAGGEEHRTAPDGRPSGVATVVATGETLHMPDARGTDLVRAGAVERVDVASALFVPVAHDGEVRRVAIIVSREAREFSGEEIMQAEALAGVAAAGLARLEAEQAATTDALTGLLNHGAMQVRVREEIARARRSGTPLSVVILDLDDFKRVNDASGHQAGDELLRNVAAVLQAELRPYDQVARYGGDEFVVLLPGSDEADARTVASRIRDAIAGVLASECSLGVAHWHEPLHADALLEHADRALMLAKRTGKGRVAVANADVERELAMMQAVHGSARLQALAAALEERDNYTHGHSERVVRFTRGVAMILGLASDQVERIAHAALVHDIGKFAVPEAILHKPGPLTPGEWEVMAEHPVAGERILLRIPELTSIAPIVRHEHEHWDGSGYPDGLRGRLIPVGSRIVLACDAYEAMITDRPYRAAMTPDEAAAELRRGIRTKFDPDVVEALLDLLGHDRPHVPDRASGVRTPASPPPPLGERR